MVIFSYILSLRLAWGMWDPVTKQDKTKQNKKEKKRNFALKVAVKFIHATNSNYYMPWKKTALFIDYQFSVRWHIICLVHLAIITTLQKSTATCSFLFSFGVGDSIQGLTDGKCSITEWYTQPLSFLFSSWGKLKLVPRSPSQELAEFRMFNFQILFRSERS